MTRKEFIDRFISILICRTSCSQLEVDEFRLLLELMPDKDEETLVSPTLTTSPKTGEFDWTVRPHTLMYGPPYPFTTASSGIVTTDGNSTSITGNINSDSITYTGTNTDSSTKTELNLDDLPL